MRSSLKSRIIIPFIMVETGLYFIFNGLDLRSLDAVGNSANTANSANITSSSLKVLSIILCLLFLVRVRKYYETDLMIGILFLTVMADVVLLFSRQFTMGIAIFLCIQLLYAYRIDGMIKRGPLIIKIIIMTACLGIGWTIYRHDFWFGLLVGLGLMYAIQFLWNIVSLSMKPSEAMNNKKFFLIGLILYALCDVHVMIYNFPSLFTANHFLKQWAAFSPMGMWLFYLPGQVFLSLSVITKKENHEND